MFLTLAAFCPATGYCAPKEKQRHTARPRGKPQADVLIPKVEILNEYELPENFNNPEGFQQYMEEIKAENLLPANQESPLAAKHQLATPQPDVITEMERWTEDIANMLLERGGVNEEGRKRVREYIESNQPKAPYSDLHLVVYLSSSVPEAAIRHLVTQLGDSENVVFAIRGFIDNQVERILPTLAWLKDHRCRTIGNDTVCARAPMDINPMLFKWLNIQQVPAIAYIAEPRTLESCTDDSLLNEDDYLVFYGDVSPEYVLKKFQEARPLDDKLKKIAEAVRPKVWETAIPAGDTGPERAASEPSAPPEKFEQQNGQTAP
jgi:type-F conjugative transfer system pilin assembly protein TrbC